MNHLTLETTLTKELVVVENYGDLESPPEDAEELTINVQVIIADIKNKLGFLPKNYGIRIGWHTIVWKEDDTISEPTQEEIDKYLPDSIKSDSNGTD